MKKFFAKLTATVLCKKIRFKNHYQSNQGRKRRMGFGKKGNKSFTIHRSEEVLPGEMRGVLSRGSSASSDGEGSTEGDRFANQISLFSFFFILLFLMQQLSDNRV